MATTIASNHCILRTKERCGIKNQRSALRNTTLALERGKGAEDFSSWEKDYLLNKSQNNCRAIAYNNFCYIVSEDDRCVTVYELPNWFGKKRMFHGKEKIRNRKKFSRFHDTVPCYC